MQLYQIIVQRLVYGDVKTLRTFEGYHPQRDHFYTATHHSGIRKVHKIVYAAANYY